MLYYCMTLPFETALDVTCVFQAKYQELVNYKNDKLYRSKHKKVQSNAYLF